jgi:hypothetical protein
MRNHHVIGLLVVLGGCEGAEAAASHPPFLADSNPPEGAVIRVGGAGSAEIMAVLGDENLGDNLYVRLLIDYPGPLDPQRLIYRAQLPPSGAVERAAIRVQPSCALNSALPNPHRLVMSVSDVPFFDPALGQDVDPGAPLDTVPDGTHRVRVVWLLDMACP